MSQRSPVRAWQQAFLCLLSVLITYFLIRVNSYPELIWLFGGLAIFNFCLALFGLYQAWERDRILSLMQDTTGTYGTSDKLTIERALKSGLKSSNQDGNGIPLGYKDNTLFYYDGPGHISIRAATNAGKTESSSANICFALGKNRNLICTAKGPELAWLAYKYRKDVLKQNVILINPWKMMAEHGLPSQNFNPVGHLVQFAKDNDPDLIDKGRKIAQTLVPDPNGPSGDGEFFRQQARDLITWSLVFLALWEATTGELCCNLPYLYNIICGSDTDMQDFLIKMTVSEDFDGTVKRASERFLGRMKRSPKTAESILSEAQNALQIYDPAGPLGKSMIMSDFTPHDLKNPNTPTSVFIVVPADKMQTHGIFSGLVLEVLTDICLQANSFEPRVTIVADEFANISKGALPSILPVLYVGRSLGVQLITYVQDTQSYKRYKQEASAFTTQAEVVMAWAIRSTKDAEEYSKRSGQKTIKVENGNIPIQSGVRFDGDYSLGLSEKHIPVMRPDEFLQLPDFTAVTFYKQNPPMVTNLLSYRMVDQWAASATPLPDGAKPADMPIKFKV